MVLRKRALRARESSAIKDTSSLAGCSTYLRLFSVLHLFLHFFLCSLNLGHKIFKTITQYDCVRFAIINIEIPQHSGSVLYKFRESRVTFISRHRGRD